MAALPAPQHGVVQAVYRLHEQRAAQEGGRQPHLDTELIGHPCDRRLWLTFRWAGAPTHPGRVLRQRAVAQAARPRFIEELRASGVEICEVDEFGRQYMVRAVGDHFGGTLDGAALRLAEAPKTWHALVLDVVDASAFEALEALGVQETQPLRYFQAQILMGLTGMERALYMAEHRGTASLYAQRLHADPVCFAQLMARAESVINAPEPPARIPGIAPHWECAGCEFLAMCHDDQVPEVNCRTCAHSTPAMGAGGRWICERKASDLDLQQQRAACASHRFIPILLERIGTQVDVLGESDGNGAVVYRMGDGSTFTNGAAPHFSSAEIASLKHKTMLGDQLLQQCKARFPGSTVVA
jgi:hypothetical protein